MATAESGPQGGGAAGRSKLAELRKKLSRKLHEQAAAAKELNDMLTSPGGLIEDSRRTLKNLDAAIVASRQPGYFKYHKPSKRIQRIRERDEPSAVTKRIRDLQREIDGLKEEIEKLEERERRRALAGVGDSALSNATRGVDAWFDTFGRPKPYPNGLTTEFAQSSKIYGGTQHHAAFKSLSTSMRRGRATR